MDWRIIILCLCLFHVSLTWWPFAENEEEDEQMETRTDSSSLPPPVSMVPFEAMSAEQKFLQESKKLLDLSPLDQCQHKVVSSLTKSCGEMNEEDLAKLSVRLLNCQSQSEGRATFPCTKDMSVAECTRPMDPHIWNTYHIISNRARSVCYATRQQQFRLQTEAAVNQLSSATIQQLAAMEALAQSNLQIRQATNESLEVLKREQVDLLQRQSLLSSSQENLRESINENIHHLNKERTIIQDRQQQLENITENIQKQLELAHEMLQSQETKRQESHNRTNIELDKLSDNVLKVWSRIDSSTHELLHKFTQMSDQYERTLTNLKAINSTVTHVLSLLDTMNKGLSLQLKWLLDNLGGAQSGLSNLTTLISHGFYLLAGCLVLLFIGVPWVSRVSLLSLVLVNVLLEIRYDCGMTLLQLTGLLVTIVIGNWGFTLYKSTSLKYKQKRKTPPLPSSPSPPPPLPQPQRTPINSTINHHMTNEVSDSEIDDLYNDIEAHDGYLPIFPPPSTPVPPLPSTLSPHRRVDTPTGYHDNKKCASVTRSGLPCRLKPHPPSPYCLRHQRM